MTPIRNAVRFRVRHALIASMLVSALLHAGLIGVLLICKMIVDRNDRPIAYGDASTKVLSDELTVDLLPPTDDSPVVDGATVVQQVNEMISNSQSNSPDENLVALQEMSQKLNSVASHQSLDELTDRFQSWMGLSTRASEPTGSVEVKQFDIASAQLHAVERTEVNGGYAYSAVLIDSRGGTLEIKMTESEGREIYELMQRFEDNPLLEKIYRRIAMPIIDRLIQTARDRAT